MSSCEVYVFRNDYIHFSHTDNVAIKHHIYFNSTVSLTCEYTVSRNFCDIIVRNCPCVAFGKICFVTCRADTLSCHLYGCTDCCILVFALNVCMVKLSRAGSCGNHEKRCRYRTRKAVRGLIYNAEFIIAGLSCNECCRSTTVEVNSLYTTCLKHDLSDFLHTTAAGEGFLTTVKYHKYNLTCLCDTNSCSGSAVYIVIFSSGNCDLTVLNKYCTKSTNSFLKLISVNFIVFLSCTYNCLTVLCNTKEAGIVNAVILLTIHDKKTAGFTCGHVKSVGVNAGNYVIVRNVVGARRISMILLCGISLIFYSLHFPAECRIVISIVCIYVYVVSCNITCCDIVYHLLSVCGSSIMDFLSDTGSELNRRRGECLVIRILNCLYIVTCKLTNVICKCIANCSSKRYKILCTGKISCTFKCSDKLVRKVFCINSISNLCTCTVCAKSICHKVSCTVLICEIFCEVALENLCKRIDLIVKIKFSVFSVSNTVVYGFKNVHNVVCVHISVIVFLAKGRIIRLVNCQAEAIVTNLSNHFFKVCGVNTFQRSYFEKVNKVACPTGNVCMVGAEVVVVCDVHSTEYVSDVSHLTVRKLELRNVLKTCNTNVITVCYVCICVIFHSSYVLSKVCILVTCHDTPRAGVITVNTCTNILDNESCRVLRGILLYVFVSNYFEKCKIINELAVSVNRRLTECGILFIRSCVTASHTTLVLAIACFCTSRSLCREINQLVTESCYKLCITFCTYLSICTICLCAGLVAECINRCLLNENFITYRTVRAFCKTCHCTCRSYCCISYSIMSKC